MKKRKEKQSLTQTHPIIAAQWCDNKNGALTPNLVTAGSGIMIYWKCDKNPDHIWSAKIYNRTNGRGCPFCANTKVAQSNSILVTHPELIPEWDEKKNAKSPSQISAGSSYRAWWICNNCEYEWQAVVGNRTKTKTGCPNCAGKVPNNNNRLDICYPKIAQQWHSEKNGTILPSMVTSKTHKKYWWKCPKIQDHEWEASPAERVGSTNPGSCPFCTSRKLDPKKTLRTISPQLAAQWHPSKNENLTPDMVHPKSNKRVWWKCKCGNEFEAKISSRSLESFACSECTKLVGSSKLELRTYCEIKTIFNSVRHREKIVKKEVDIFLPDYSIAIEIDGGYYHKNKEKKEMEKNHALFSVGVKLIRVRDSLLKTTDCTEVTHDAREKPIGIIKKIFSRLSEMVDDDNTKKKLFEYIAEGKYRAENEFLDLISRLPGPLPGKSLLEVDPELASEWDVEENLPLTPDLVFSQSNFCVVWKCRQNHRWSAAICNRRKINNKRPGCPYCSGNIPSEKNNLAVASPEIINEWSSQNEKAPNDYTPKSHKIVYWKCLKNPEHPDYPMSIQNRVKGSACPYCAGKKVCHSNSLSATHPDIAKEWNYQKNGLFTPEQVVHGTGRKYWWICANGHEWLESPNKRTSRGRCCKICKKMKIGISDG